MKTLTDWLAELPHISNVMRVTASVGRTRYQGARYDRTSTYTAGMMAVQDGRAKAGDTYSETFLYLLGDLPAAWKRDKRTCFRFDGDGGKDWFVAAYADAATAARNTEFMPNGAHFMLCPWGVEPAIDAYEDKPYRRVQITVQS